MSAWIIVHVEVVTLIIALLGLLLSVASITWQIIQHQLSGARVRTGILWGGIGPDRIATGPVEGTLEAFRHTGVTETIMAVQGRNVGRLPVDVTGFSVEVEGGSSVSYPGWNRNPTLPHRLDGGSVVTYHLPLDLVQAAVEMKAQSSSYTGRIRGKLDLATGAVQTSDWVRFPPTKN